MPFTIAAPIDSAGGAYRSNQAIGSDKYLHVIEPNDCQDGSSVLTRKDQKDDIDDFHSYQL